MPSVSATISDLLGALNQSFRLSALFPASLFVLANIVLAQEYASDTPLYRLVASSGVAIFIVAFAIALAISYSLTILNVPLTQLYEGYSFRQTWFGKLLIEMNVQRRQWLDNEIKRLVKVSQTHRDNADFQEALLGPEHWRDQTFKNEHRNYIAASTKQADLTAELLNSFPLQEQAILPTRMGNAFSTFEDYPKHRYSISAVTLWPRLVPSLIKSGYAEIVERQKMGFDFFLNLSFLSAAFTLEYAGADLYYVAHLALRPLILGVFIAWLFYRFAIFAAIGFGTTVKVSFDLHRDTLRESLGLRMPNDFEEEKQLWESYSNFVAAMPSELDDGDDLKGSVFKYPRSSKPGETAERRVDEMD